MYARNIAAEQMPLLLQRAKIVLDLGMPGSERLSEEGLLMGAVPIISSRWVGASRIDFPGLHRVDHSNMSQISETIAHVARNYESELRAAQNTEYLAYRLSSMLLRDRDTVDAMFASSYIHFLLSAHNLQDEYLATLQMLGLIYLFPLATIDIYVADVLWFMRHHYGFFSMLRQAGYVRADPFVPDDFLIWKREEREQQQPRGTENLQGFRGGFVRVRSVRSLRDMLTTQNDAAAASSAPDGSTSDGPEKTRNSHNTTSMPTSENGYCRSTGTIHNHPQKLEQEQAQEGRDLFRPPCGTAAAVGLAPTSWPSVLVALRSGLLFRSPEHLLNIIGAADNFKRNGAKLVLLGMVSKAMDSKEEVDQPSTTITATATPAATPAPAEADPVAPGTISLPQDVIEGLVIAHFARMDDISATLANVLLPAFLAAGDQQGGKSTPRSFPTLAPAAAAPIKQNGKSRIEQQGSAATSDDVTTPVYFTHVCDLVDRQHIGSCDGDGCRSSSSNNDNQSRDLIDSITRSIPWVQTLLVARSLGMSCNNSKIRY